MICPSHLRRAWFAHALAAAVVLICVALYFNPPGQASFWPECPIHQLFGIECPGCGATRALAALMHGHLGEAMRFNALFVLMLPLGIMGAVKSYRRAIQPGRFSWPHPSGFAVYSGIAVSAIFTVTRNLAH